MQCRSIRDTGGLAEGGCLVASAQKTHRFVSSGLLFVRVRGRARDLHVTAACVAADGRDKLLAFGENTM